MPNQEDILHQQELLATYRRTLAKYLEQQANQGGQVSASMPVLSGVEEAREGIRRAKDTLRSWTVEVEDLPDDEPSAIARRYAHTWPMVRVRVLLIAGVAAAVIMIGLAVTRGGILQVFRGSVGTVINSSGSITINQGDPPEVRQQKVNQAKQLIATEVLANIMNMDARLGFVSTSLAAVTAPDPLQSARQTVAPATSDQNASLYHQQIAESQSANLRQALNSRPLRSDTGAPLIQVLVDSGVDPSDVRFFYDQLTQVQDASESLLATMSSSSKASDQQTVDYYHRQVNLAADVLRNRSNTAHVAGLIVLRDLGTPPPNMAQQLATLRYLEPRRAIIDDADAQALLTENKDQATRLTAQREQLLREGQQLLATTTNDYEQLSAELTIQPTDPWNIVVAKARSLRDLDRIDLAVAAFAKYGEMFASSDLTASQYAHTAQQFTLQMKQLGLNGGVYIYQIAPGSDVQRAGLAVGDILIEYDDRPLHGMDDLTKALSDTSPDVMVHITYLRLDAQNRFTQQTATLSSRLGGAGMMPI